MFYYLWIIRRGWTFKGFPRWLSDKNLPANAGDTGDVGSVSGLGWSPGKGSGNPLQCSYLGTEEPSRLQSMGCKETLSSDWACTNKCLRDSVLIASRRTFWMFLLQHGAGSSSLHWESLVLSTFPCWLLWLDILDLLHSDVAVKIVGGYARSRGWMTFP